MKSTILSVSKFGFVFGLGLCLYTTLMWLTKLDANYLYIGQYLDIAIILLPIIIISIAIKQKNDNDSVKFWERILIAVYIGLISYLMYEPFLFTYHHYINPTWFDAVLSLKQSSLEASHASADEIKQTLNKMTERNLAQDKIYSLSNFIPSVLIVPILISLLSILYIRKKKK